MSNRLGLISPKDLNETQKVGYDVFEEQSKRRNRSGPQFALEDGTLIGPFGVLIHHSQLAAPYLQFVKALQAIPGLSLYEREVVVAVAGSRSQAAYENYAHAIIGQQAGLSETELHDIHHGKCPDSLTEKGKAAFELATALGQPGPLDQRVWDKTVEVLGRDGAAAAVHFTAFYNYVGCVLNGFDVQIP